MGHGVRGRRLTNLIKYPGPFKPGGGEGVKKTLPGVLWASPEALKSDLGRVLGSILRETGRQGRKKGSWDRFWEPFWLPK